MTSGRGGAEKVIHVGESPTASFDALYEQQWWPMLRVAVGLVDDRASAEDVVQDAFAALFRRWDTLRDPAAATAYLRTSVVNAARSTLRRRGVARRHLHLTTADPVEDADHSSLRSAEHHELRHALRTLPQRQREVLTLRYLTEMSDSDIAATTGLSPSGVRSAASRGLTALRSTIGGQS